jgi:hypothetical protein
MTTTKTKLRRSLDLNPVSADVDFRRRVEPIDQLL